MRTLLLFILGAVVLAVAGDPSGTDLTSATVSQQGNVNCDAAVTAVDALQVLRSVAGLSTSAACLQDAGDTNCDGAVTAVDALRILRYVAGLQNQAVNNCPLIGEPVAPEGPLPTSYTLIDEGLAEGKIDAETALVYKVFASFGDDRLPQEYTGEQVDLGDAGIIAEASSNWNVLSENTRLTLKPFFMPPIYEGSWGDPNFQTTTMSLPSRALSSPTACQEGAQPAILPGWHIRVTAHFKIWYSDRDVGAGTDPAQSAQAAELLANEVEYVWNQETDLVERYPLQDHQETCNGGDGAWDIYMYRKSRSVGALTVAYPSGCELRPSFTWIAPDFAVSEGAGGEYNARSIFAHEFMHMIQFGAYDYGTDCTEYDWLGEATGNWAADYVYPNDQFEFKSAWRYFNWGEFTSSLEKGMAGNNGYSDYLFLFYLTHKTGNPKLIRDIWDATEVYDSLSAIDLSIPGGFQERWPEYALFNYNTPPITYYQEWDKMTERLPVDFNTPYEPFTSEQFQRKVDLKGEVKKEFWAYQYDTKWDPEGFGWDANSPIPHVALRPKKFEFVDDRVKLAVIENGLAGLPGANVQALIKISGQELKVEDWTNRGLVYFCRDAPEQRVEELTLIISNSGRLNPPFEYEYEPKLTAYSTGCTKWTGWVRHTHHGGLFLGHEVAETELAENVVFELDQNLLDPNLPPREWVTTSGMVNWTHTGSMFGCSGSGSGSYPIGPLSAGEGFGQLAIWDDGGDRLRYSAEGDGNLPPPSTVMYQCPEGGEVPGGPVGVAWWWGMTLDEFRVQPDGTIRDTAIITYPEGLGDDTWEWEFHPAP